MTLIAIVIAAGALAALILPLLETEMRDLSGIHFRAEDIDPDQLSWKETPREFHGNMLDDIRVTANGSIEYTA